MCVSFLGEVEGWHFLLTTLVMLYKAVKRMYKTISIQLFFFLPHSAFVSFIIHSVLK